MAGAAPAADRVARPVALVTGGSGGIGRACAAVLAERGYDVVLAGRRSEALKDAAAELGCRAVAADCSVEAEVDRLMEAAGDLAFLVHAAGVLDGRSVRRQPVEVFDRVMTLNLRSAYLVTRAALSRMGPGSRIVYIASTAGIEGMRGLSAYSASKAGMIALADSVAAEVERDGIAVHVVSPAPVRTDMIDPASRKVMLLLEPEDVASAVGWLDSLHPRVAVRELVLRSVTSGPFVPPTSAAGE